jgi:hypothetical protein
VTALLTMPRRHRTSLPPLTTLTRRAAYVTGTIVKIQDTAEPRWREGTISLRCSRIASLSAPTACRPRTELDDWSDNEPPCIYERVDNDEPCALSPCSFCWWRVLWFIRVRNEPYGHHHATRLYIRAVHINVTNGQAPPTQQKTNCRTVLA